MFDAGPCGKNKDFLYKLYTISTYFFDVSIGNLRTDFTAHDRFDDVFGFLTYNNCCYSFNDLFDKKYVCRWNKGRNYLVCHSFK